MIGFESGRRTLLSLGMAGFFGAMSLPAHAQDQQAENVAAARSLGIQGVQLADAGKCPEAIEKLSRAEALYHAPTILGRLGECQVTVGQIVLGTENLNRVVREQLPANAPKAFKSAQERAAKVLETALPRIAYLTVIVEPHEANASVSVGGAAVPSALIGAERPTDPGKHEVLATAPGYLDAKTDVELAEGARQAVTLKLTLDPNAPVTPPPVAATPVAQTPNQPPPADKAEGGGTKTVGYILLGVGGVGLATGAITGMMALGKKNDLDCPNKKCTGAEADKLDSANTLALVSTIGVGVGVAAATVGVVLIATSGGKKDAPPTANVGGMMLRPYIGAKSAGVTGTF